MSPTSPTTRWMSPPPIYDSLQESSSLKPYLSLSHLLSLTWLAYPILSLLFVAFRLQLSSTAAQDAVSDAKDNLLTACQAAEKAATAAASLPRFMAAATNEQITDAVNGSMNAARATLVLALTILEGVLNFVIDTYRSTFLCFLELVVRGGLGILISAVNEISTFIENTLGGIRTSIQNDVATANSAIASAVSALNKINPFGDISVPQFSIPSLTALQNVTIPTDFEDALVRLNSTLPSVAQVKDAIENIVDTPFELLKKDINDTFISLSFDASVLPVPEENKLSFCGELDTSIVADLGRDLLKAAQIGTVILIALALLLIGANCALEWYKWRCMRRHLEYTRQAWRSDPTLVQTDPQSSIPSFKMTDHNLLILASSSSHPLLTRIANNLSALLRLTPRQHTNLRWFFNYVFHPPALACFLIGFFGLLSVQLQLIAIGPIQDKFSAQVSASVADFSNTIATSINASMFNQSALYADSINGRVDTIQTTINEGVFGWVNGTTSTLNDTLVTFYADIQNAISTVFNGTILEAPVQDFVRCLIGTKIEAIENALTFLHDNLVINMPRVNQSVLVLSPATVQEATRPISLAAVGGGKGDGDNDGGLVGRLVNRYVSALKKERVVFGIFMGLWAIVVFMAICILLYNSYWKPIAESRKRRRWQQEQRGGVEGLVVPFRLDLPVGLPAKSEKEADLVSFTPGLSPKRSRFFSLRFPNASSPQQPTDVPFEQEKSDYSLNALRPADEKKWDVYSMSHSGPPESPRPLWKKGPRKLTAIGRRGMGREVLVSDEERARMDAAEARGEVEEPAHPGWFKRALSTVRRKDHGQQSSEIAETMSSRPKPNLTISTVHTGTPTDRNDLPDIDNTHSQENVPGSAWSVSPGVPRALPWLLPAKRSITSPVRPPPRRNASVPLSVDSTYGPSAVETPGPASPARPMHQVAVPLHHGYERHASSASLSISPPRALHSTYTPQPPSRHSLAPPRDHRRSSSVPFAQYHPPLDMTPVTRTLTSNHARESSQSIDPFRTPFDDEHGAPARQSVRKSSNPFTNYFAVAL